MNVKFILNEYVLIWHLLFRQSISKELNEKKQKIWFNHKSEYNQLYKEKDVLLDDPENYIPTDDTIYNIMRDSEIYKNIYNYTNKYRLSLLEDFDKLKKEFHSIIRIRLDKYNVYLLDPRLNIIDYLDDTDNMIYGIRKNSSKEEILIFMYNILRKYVLSNGDNNSKVIDAVCELCVLNELYTRVSVRSHYLDGNSELISLKRKIYPFFLMYLGIKESRFLEYMKRDGIIFDSKYYKYNYELQEMNILEFINFCDGIRRGKEKDKELELI